MSDRGKEPLRIMLMLLTLACFSSVAYGQTGDLQPENTGEARAVQELSPKGRVGVVAAQFKPDIRLDKPMTKGEAALLGAKAGALLPPVAGVTMGGPGGGIFGILAAPVGVAVGTVAGAIKGTSKKEIAESEGVLRNHVGVLAFQEMLSERLEAAARAQGQYSYVPLDLQGPESPVEESTYDMVTFKDVDAVLEIGVRDCGLEQSRGTFNSYLRFFMRVEARLFTARQGKLYDGPFFYSSSYDKRLGQWNADDARLLRRELDVGLQSLAREIVEKVHSVLQPQIEECPEGVETIADKAVGGQSTQCATNARLQPLLYTIPWMSP